jgi:hypothetical protein
VLIGSIVILAIAIAAGVVASTYWFGGGDGASEHGSVSHQWLAEHRSSQAQDPRR